ncbi:MAG: FAD-dependent oxidoreductase [Myxococcota bacterium]
MEKQLEGRAVAVVGGATAGAEVAFKLAEAGATVVVFEQNRRPYGKVEDGLPRWHAAQRTKEYGVIDKKLSHPNVSFVPDTKFGYDVTLDDLENHWGFNIVVLALGAWRDRPLPLNGADTFVGKGLVYQNPLIYWFNHKHEPGYSGETFSTPDGAIVIGGGLASIDIAKIMMLETVREKLAERGYDIDLAEIEHKGIDKTLAKLEIDFADLGLQGATLYYRKRREDMPLVAIPRGADEKRRERAFASRARVADKAQSKYLFNIAPLMNPQELIVEDGTVVGVRFQPMKHEDGKFVAEGEPVDRRGPVVVSSIGSIPEPLPGVPMKGELFDFVVLDEVNEVVHLAGHPTVYAAGNAVTGKGNIAASKKHGTEVAEQVANWLLGEGDRPDVETANEAHASAVGEAIVEKLIGSEPLSTEAMNALHGRVKERWDAVGYSGNYAAWMA